jgi:hypothetical protein
MNRIVIFTTSNVSFHGHPDPLQTPHDVTRKSIALYYYTALSREEYLEDKVECDSLNGFGCEETISTIFMPRPNEVFSNDV